MVPVFGKVNASTIATCGRRRPHVERCGEDAARVRKRLIVITNLRLKQTGLHCNTSRVRCAVSALALAVAAGCSNSLAIPQGTVALTSSPPAKNLHAVEVLVPFGIAANDILFFQSSSSEPPTVVHPASGEGLFSGAAYVGPSGNLFAGIGPAGRPIAEFAPPEFRAPATSIKVPAGFGGSIFLEDLRRKVLFVGGLAIVDFRGASYVLIYSQPYSDKTRRPTKIKLAPGEQIQRMVLSSRGDLFVFACCDSTLSSSILMYEPPYARPPSLQATIPGLGVDFGISRDGVLFALSEEPRSGKGHVYQIRRPYDEKPTQLLSFGKAPTAMVVNSRDQLFFGISQDVVAYDPPYSRIGRTVHLAISKFASAEWMEVDDRDNVFVLVKRDLNLRRPSIPQGFGVFEIAPPYVRPSWGTGILADPHNEPPSEFEVYERDPNS
jgi:hypothetical protein